MKTLSTRGHQVAQTIALRETFKTHGALQGRVVEGLGRYDCGQLADADKAKFIEQCDEITYVVYSYVTPIAWYTPKHGWHKVEQKFSPTTSTHQGRLYMIDQGGH